MSKGIISLIIGVIVVVVVAMVQATSSTASVVLLPSELVTRGDMSRVRVGGRVTGNDYLYTVEPAIRLEFSIGDPGKAESSPSTATVRVVYDGLKPDMFAAGRDVIVDGDYVNGTLVAAKLLTQCPSKYEPPKPNAQ